MSRNSRYFLSLVLLLHSSCKIWDCNTVLGVPACMFPSHTKSALLLSFRLQSSLNRMFLLRDEQGVCRNTGGALKVHGGVSSLSRG
jgi:hypothetical protein